MQINTKAFKAKLTQNDIDKVLKALGIPVFSKGATYRLYTGCHHKNPYDGGKNLIFYPKTGCFQCCSQCGATFDVIALTQKRLALENKPSDFMSAVKFIADVVGMEIGEIERKSSPDICDWHKGLDKFIRIKHGESSLQIYDSNILNQLDDFYPQSWIDEGITADTMEKYGIRWYDRTSQICIPCRDEVGNLIGIRCRNTDAEMVANAKYIPLTLLDGKTLKFPTNSVFYNINYAKEFIEKKKEVFLFEGEKSCMLFDQITGGENNSLALYGSNIGLRRKMDLMKMGVERVILCLDSDFHEYGDSDYDRFEKNILKQAEQFRSLCKVDIVYNNIGLKDFYKCSPVDKGVDVWNKLYQNREAII